MSMPNKFSKLLDSELRLFLPADKCVMSVPKQSDVWRVCASENLTQSGRIGEVAVRFDKHRNLARSCVGPQFVQRGGDATHNLFPGTFDIVAKYSDVGRAHGRSQIDESLCIRDLLAALGDIHIVQMC